ncbi:RNA polymerase sigma factor [Rhizobium leguminosarum]|uniref:RNA polymerase sigma factor n=1 Tax=Rhizobium leguminosarum TaxID=384 RepID=UPI0010300D27|nr:RNA polymerase sigma factor [Rhizobium leguminosarum]TAU90815.1 RNA polymerase sigma factor [Rhizobium leguminosarum]TAX57715.1 RNA polymerase sigma factor [Rhizobium leguminosarum]TAX62056.1 RNA polymerase sigma factor [Rhizobium leguminosarum]TAY03585.1 RNA polymerase sigma factor [Rhizobium leguminosarum]
MSASSDVTLIGELLVCVRPKVMAGLMRYFRDFDLAEEAFQNSCLRALQSWPLKGRPRDAAAWLILVGRNATIEDVRRRQRTEPLPSADRLLTEIDDGESLAAERLDGSHYRDDILRLLFMCCQPGLPLTQQIALALRVVCGMSPLQIANAFLVNERAMQQRITRAKTAVANSGLPFEPPSLAEREERLTSVLGIIYLTFNQGYTAGPNHAGHSPLCTEAIRLARLLLGLFPSEPEVMGLAALLLIHQSRWASRFDESGCLVSMDQQDRELWDQELIAEGVALIDKAMRHRSTGPYQIQAALAAVHVQATAGKTDWVQIERLYGALERLQPSPVIALNRAVAVSEISGPQVALDLIDPLAHALSGYFNYFGVRGSLLLKLGRAEEACTAFDRAIALSRTAAEAVYIRSQIDACIRLAAGEAGHQLS